MEEVDGIILFNPERKSDFDYMQYVNRIIAEKLQQGTDEEKLRQLPARYIDRINHQRAKDYINLNQEYLDKKIITLDGIRFNNINDAVYWIAKKYKLSNDINLSVIKRRLISAINLQKEYFGRTWRYDKR